jgi:OOP family OmpA-OmpF porin
MCSLILTNGTCGRNRILELDRVVKLLNENPAIEIEMSAHTDSRGSDDYNFKLSDNRARSVMEYILSKGIAPNRITSKGYGETKPWCRTIPMKTGS